MQLPADQGRLKVILSSSSGLLLKGAVPAHHTMGVPVPPDRCGLRSLVGVLALNHWRLRGRCPRNEKRH